MIPAFCPPKITGFLPTDRYWIYDSQQGPPPPPCTCDENEFVNDFDNHSQPTNVDNFLPVQDSPVLVAHGLGWVKLTPERTNREVQGRENTSIVTLAIYVNPAIKQGQWAIVERNGIRDYGGIIEVDRRRIDMWLLKIDTSKTFPFTISEELIHD